MDFNATIDLIIKDLKEASEIIDDLKKYPGIPLLQVELAKLKCKSAGEVIAMLKTMNQPAYVVEKEPLQEEKVQHQAVSEQQKTPSVPEIIFYPPSEKTEEADAFEIELPLLIKEPTPKRIQKKEQESSILADKFSNVANSFNEQLGIMNSDDDLAEILKSQPITSLLEAIGINDKFLFIREIFNGNHADYAQAISRLENTENLTDAKAIIMSYTGDNFESDAVLQLLDLVKRKLPSNE
jgi:hypothetical protein